MGVVGNNKDVGFFIHLAENENIWLSVMRLSELFKEEEKEAKQMRSSKLFVTQQNT